MNSLYRSFVLLFSSFSFILIYHHHCYFAFLTRTYKRQQKCCLSFFTICMRERALFYVRPDRPTRWFLQAHLLVLTVRRFSLFAVNALFSLSLSCFFSLVFFYRNHICRYIFACASFTTFFSFHRHTTYLLYQNKHALDHNIFVLTNNKMKEKKRKRKHRKLENDYI